MKVTGIPKSRLTGGVLKVTTLTMRSMYAFRTLGAPQLCIGVARTMAEAEIKSFVKISASANDCLCSTVCLSTSVLPASCVSKSKWGMDWRSMEESFTVPCGCAVSHAAANSVASLSENEDSPRTEKDNLSKYGLVTVAMADITAVQRQTKRSSRRCIKVRQTQTQASRRRRGSSSQQLEGYSQSWRAALAGAPAAQVSSSRYHTTAAAATQQRLEGGAAAAKRNPYNMERVERSLAEAKSEVEGRAEDYVDDDDEDEEEDDDEGEGTSRPEVQLGFIGDDPNPLFKDLNWQSWDGGRVGGRPVWLDGVNPPVQEQVACKICSDPLKFLLQIYCPLDEPASAFHRALYVFCCKKASCVSGGSVVCIRSQLARDNALYPGVASSSSSSSSSSPSPLPSPPAAADESSPQYCSLCAVCGCRGPLRCSVCKMATYCSKTHQKFDWKRHKKYCNQGQVAVQEQEQEQGQGQEGVWAFPEFSLNVEPEEFDDSEIDASTSIWEDAVTAGGKDEEDDAKLTQADYDHALGSEASDPVYIRFLTRVKRGGPEQVLRYCRWDKRSGGGPLAISSSFSQDGFSPPLCQHCGAARSFECQIMPQLLHFLRVENKTLMTASAETARLLQQEAPLDDGQQVFRNALNEDIDWGTIDIFTCTASCQPAVGGPNAVEEAVRIQPPPPISRTVAAAKVSSEVISAPKSHE